MGEVANDAVPYEDGVDGEDSWEDEHSFAEVDDETYERQAMDILTRRKEEEKEVIATMARLRVEDELARNPIWRFAPELFAEIFSWYLHDLYQSGCPSTERDYAWLKLSRVCRTWRDVLLLFPRLSTNISITHPDDVQELLRRSATLPLHIYEAASPTSRTNEQVALRSRRLVFENLERVESAQLTVTSDLVVTERTPENIRIGTSIMRKLDLSYPLPPHIHRSAWHFQNREINLSPLLPNFKFPYLQELSCSGIFRSFRGIVSPTLRTLKVFEPFRRITARELARILQQLPLLEELVLHGVCSTNQLAQGGFAPASLVTLPNLRLISVRDEWIENAWLVLQHVTYPATASAYLGADNHSTIAEGEPMILALIAKASGQGFLDATARPRSVYVKAGKVSVATPFTLSWWVERRSIDEMYAERSSTTRAEGSFHIMLDSSHSRWTSRLLERLPFDTVETAFLSEAAVSERHFFPREPLGTIPRLEELMLEYELFGGDRPLSSVASLQRVSTPLAALASPAKTRFSLMNFFAAARPAPTLPEVAPVTVPVPAPQTFPALRVLRVRERSHNGRDVPPGWDSDLRHLAHSLAARKATENPNVQELHLTHECVSYP